MGAYGLIIAKRAGRVHYTPDFLSRALVQKEDAELEETFKRSNDRTHELAHKATAMQQFKRYSPAMSEARLHHEVISAELVDEAVDDGSLV